MSRLQIREDDLTGKKIADFLREHLENMNEITPPVGDAGLQDIYL
jgi:putative acetyltransferase